MGYTIKTGAHVTKWLLVNGMLRRLDGSYTQNMSLVSEMCQLYYAYLLVIALRLAPC